MQDIQKRAWSDNNALSQDRNATRCIFKICGLKNRLNPDDDVKDTFGFRDLQLSLEVGFKNGKIEPCQEHPDKAWGPGVKQHICEVQVLIKTFDEVLERYTYGKLRDMAGK